MEEKERPEQNPEETPEVYVVKKDLAGWRFDRRTFLTAAGASAAAAALASCGSPEPVVVMVTETASPIPPTSTLAPPGPSPEPQQATTAPEGPTEAPSATQQPPVAGETAVPTATVAPTNTSTTEPPRAEFVKDVTVPDGTQMRQGQAFTKTWRYRNSGTVPWGEGVKLVFVSGSFGGYQSNQLGGPDFVSVPNVAPGESVDLSVNLVAPNSYGHYRSYWRLQLPNGEWLENNHYADIVVQAPATATRPATAVPPTAVQPTACPCVGHQACGCDGDCGCDNDTHYWHPN